MSSSKGLQAKGHPNHQVHLTPSMMRRKLVQQSNAFRSPTDNLLSPCSLKLLKLKLKNSGSDKVSNAKKISKCDIDGKENNIS